MADNFDETQGRPMTSSRGYVNESHYPDGLTPMWVDALCMEAFGSPDPLAGEPAPPSDVPGEPADHRRHRRAVRRAANSVVRVLPARPAATNATDGEAA
jgi:hypothetical protein